VVSAAPVPSVSGVVAIGSVTAGSVVLGSSSTALIHLIANAMGDARAEGTLDPNRNQIVISTTGHEANIWPWARLASRGFDIRWWNPARKANGDFGLNLEALGDLLSPRTALVAFPQVSNVLGEVWDARAVCAMAAASGARSMVDGVAYAPHRLPDVQQLGCDWYVYSTYKVFGPHMAAIYGSAAAFSPLTGPNHPFIDRSQLPYKFELGGVNHECAAMLAATSRYFEWLAGETDHPAQPARRMLEQAFKTIDAIEAPLQQRLLAGLKDLPGVEIIGPSTADDARVCTVSFVVRGRPSAHFCRSLNARGLGCKAGHFYSRRLVEQMGIAPDDGVIRVSLAHYNTVAEVELFLLSLRELIESGAAG
jgi:selenocysteine lyase/cysteine desulfurase